MDTVASVPEPFNEPVRGYAPGSPDRESLRRRLAELEGERVELTMTIGGGQRMAGGERIDVVQPHDHGHILGVTAQPSWPPRPGVSCPSTSARPSCCARPICWPGRGGTRSTRRPCSASPRPCSRRRSTAPAS